MFFLVVLAAIQSIQKTLGTAMPARVTLRSTIFFPIGFVDPALLESLLIKTMTTTEALLMLPLPSALFTDVDVFSPFVSLI